MTAPDLVLQFWFEELTPKQWFMRDDEVDAAIAGRFVSVHAQAAAGEFWGWRKTALGRLAEILVLDQFSRNLYRDDPRAFAQDPMALALSQEALSAGALAAMPSADHKAFLIMPFMHSESRPIHEEAVRLFSLPGLESNLAFELRHKDVIDRFGRYPHRNALLGRVSTAEETAFLAANPQGF